MFDKLERVLSVLAVEAQNFAQAELMLDEAVTVATKGRQKYAVEVDPVLSAFWAAGKRVPVRFVPLLHLGVIRMKLDDRRRADDRKRHDGFAQVPCDVAGGCR